MRTDENRLRRPPRPRCPKCGTKLETKGLGRVYASLGKIDQGRVGLKPRKEDRGFECPSCGGTWELCPVVGRIGAPGATDAVCACGVHWPPGEPVPPHLEGTKVEVLT